MFDPKFYLLWFDRINNSADKRTLKFYCEFYCQLPGQKIYDSQKYVSDIAAIAAVAAAR